MSLVLTLPSRRRSGRRLRIAAAAAAFGVAARVAHIARLALSVNDAPDYWRAVLAALPAGTAADEEEREFLPGISRFASETGMRGPGLGPARVWLRTHYVAPVQPAIKVIALSAAIAPQ